MCRSTNETHSSTIAIAATAAAATAATSASHNAVASATNSNFKKHVILQPNSYSSTSQVIHAWKSLNQLLSRHILSSPISSSFNSNQYPTFSLPSPSSSFYLLKTDPQFLHNLNSLLKHAINKLFPKHSFNFSNTIPPYLSHVLASFKARIRIWFNIGYFLSTCLSFYPNLSKYIDSQLYKHTHFQTILSQLPSATAALIQSTRITANLPDPNALQAYSYFVRYFKAKHNLDLQQLHQTTNQFYTTRSSNSFNAIAKPKSISALFPYLHLITETATIERFICTHTFPNQDLHSFQLFRKHVVAKQFQSRFSKAQRDHVFQQLFYKPKAIYMKLIYNWFSLHPNPRVQLPFLHHLSNHFACITSQLCSSNQSISHMHFLNLWFTNYMRLHAIQIKHFPSWYQFHDGLNQTVCDLITRYAGVPMHELLPRHLTYFLNICVRNNPLISRKPILTSLNVLALLLDTLSDENQRHFLKYAQVLLAERLVYHLADERDIIFDHALQSIGKMSRTRVHILDFPFPNLLDHHSKVIQLTAFQNKFCSALHVGHLILPAFLQTIQIDITTSYKSQFPLRHLKHVNYLSSVILQTACFDEQNVVELHLNMYQVAILLFFDECEEASYEDVRSAIIDHKQISSEKYDEEKIRVRQALISMSCRSAPLLVACGKEGRLEKMKLNRDFKSKAVVNVVTHFRNSYLNALCEKEKWCVRENVKKLVREILSIAGNMNVSHVVDLVMKEHIHAMMTPEFVYDSIATLESRGEVMTTKNNILIILKSTDL